MYLGMIVNQYIHGRVIVCSQQRMECTICFLRKQNFVTLTLIADNAFFMIAKVKH